MLALPIRSQFMVGMINAFHEHSDLFVPFGTAKLSPSSVM
jgi:hypothetical protein